jgi:hypothetical protein
VTSWGRVETTLIFHDGLELSDFAAFDLLKNEAGTAAVRKYFSTYARIAQDNATGFVLESVTWRANPDWATQLGYSSQALAEMNRKAIGVLEDIRDTYATQGKELSARQMRVASEWTKWGLRIHRRGGVWQWLD